VLAGTRPDLVNYLQTKKPVTMPGAPRDTRVFELN